MTLQTLTDLSKICHTNNINTTQADTNALKNESCQTIAYVLLYITLSSLSYNCMWWRLYHAPITAEWQLF